MSAAGAEQFLPLAKTARGSAAVDLVNRILEHPEIYGFDEFLRIDSFQNALKKDHPQHLATLELFAYGTLTDYESERSRFIPLSPNARRKLQLLTLASLAVHARTIPYSLLLKQLQVESVRELEDLIIDGIYSQIIRGKLDQLNNYLHVEYAIARGINSTAYQRMEDVLNKWCINCACLLNVLKQEAKLANEKKKKSLDEQDRYTKDKLSVMKVIELQQGQNSKRDIHDDYQFNTFQNVANKFTGSIDSTQGGTKKSARHSAKRNLRS